MTAAVAVDTLAGMDGGAAIADMILGYDTSTDGDDGPPDEATWGMSDAAQRNQRAMMGVVG